MGARLARGALGLLVLAGTTLGQGAAQAGAEGAFPAPDSARVGLEEALATGTRWLLAHQNEDGSFGSHHSPRPIEVLASFPGSQEAFRVATTALCVLALREVGSGEAETAAARRTSIARALDFLLAESAVKRQSGMEHYNVWAFGYTLQCFGEELLRDPRGDRVPALRGACARLVEKLAAYQTLDGGWGYLSLDAVPTFQPSFTSMSFTTATILVGLERARAAGVEVPAALVRRAVGEIERSRLPDGAFLYGDYLQYSPRHVINERSGSACRGPVCLLALDRLGPGVPASDFERALDDLLVRFPDYQKAGVRRPIPHESWFAISGYFYLYGHAYAAWALEELPREKRRKAAELLVQAVMYCRDPDGSFWDYPLYSYHKPYGTAFALITLARARRALGER
ncbi:MAG TPA: prenyltransferase/squalene oxidase repeat-containing protein [Planctomycetota bacterium]